ncbi:hypothetical protein TCAL_00868 [Tigriopus californicus]|uniref:Thioredoxin domain-containing protein 17 n=1 Tax=Tigriopus californicus TaxID=6832 RepID=A0A553NB32_TIGCA|nr:thioredoxin domain-containing protein 17-like [Tigriopus californicus]TRY62654.1 hypothetical protein TCAL_00868 [Tigriopus californicus]|eukprot:TCALIF_00868-PA protein Name:"Similar to Txndc17 Thioredoxin domain-containing protein 17 (Mus musculus)" AED:0.09 eAED:0.09 QI:0/0/0/1/1/1/2/0/129
MVQKYKVEGFEAFEAKLADIQREFAGKTVLVLFSGSKDPKTHQSWCPDCVTAEPVVQACLDKAPEPEQVVFLYVGVGSREFWKDPQCIFRTHQSTQLKAVPTLIKWGSPQRLEESQCNRPDMVEMLFDD